MVALSAEYNFTSVVDEFLQLKPFTGPHGEHLRSTVRARAMDILAHPDIRYMPAFKLLDLIADMVTIAREISAEHQLRRMEATALLQSHISDAAPLIAHCMLEAALERARYEPIMLDASGADALAYRNLTLHKRWQAMLCAHHAHSALPPAWSHAVQTVVEQAILAPAFAQYRVGPLLQFFAEMLQHARQLHVSAAPLTQLADHIGEHSPLWKRYALKVSRYKAHTHDNPTEDARVLPTQARIPVAISASAKHALH